MTRLTEDDVRGLTAGLLRFESGLVQATGLTLRSLALRTAALDWATPEKITDLPKDPLFACVPITTGEGLISGFGECVSVILRHMAWRTLVTQPDVRGIQEAVDAGAEVLFMADDHRFIALNVRKGRCVDDDPATAHGYVTALEAAAGGLAERPVLLLGLGPVGRAAAERLLARGALLSVAEPDAERRALARSHGITFETVELERGIDGHDLIFDATPAPAVIDAQHVGPATIAAVPGIPSAFTAAARAKLGVRHIHEPLAIGVAVMAARALA